jgi:hypothetical protein
VEYWLQRPLELRAFDDERQADPNWFLSEKIVGIVLYVDLFSDHYVTVDDNLPNEGYLALWLVVTLKGFHS